MSSKFKTGDRIVATFRPGWWGGTKFVESEFHGQIAPGAVGHVISVEDDGDLYIDWGRCQLGYTSPDRVKLKGAAAESKAPELKVGDRVRVRPGARNEFGERPWHVGKRGIVGALHGDGDVTMLADPSDGEGDSALVHRDYLEVLPREAEPELDVPKFKVGDRVKVLPGAYAFGGPVHDARPDLVGKVGVVEVETPDEDGDVYVHLEGEGGRYINIDFINVDFVELVDEAPAFSAGDRVRLSEEPRHSKAPLPWHSGKAGTVVRGPDTDGDYCIELDDEGGAYVSPECLTLRTTAPSNDDAAEAGLGETPTTSFTAGTHLDPADVATLYKAGIITRAEARAALGLTTDA